jgi:hypothetical protein
MSIGGGAMTGWRALGMRPVSDEKQRLATGISRQW